jgi:hypothetical protein
MLNVLNGREMAAAIWFAIGLTVCLTRSDLRPGIGGLAVALTRAKLFATLLLMAAYVGVIIVLAARLGAWDPGLAGATVAWVLGSATVLLMNAIRHTHESGYLRRAIVQSAGVAVLIEGLVNLYAFPVYVEFFTLPALALLAATAAFADGKPEYASVRRLINVLLGTVGFSFTLYATIRLATSLSGATLAQHARSVALPVWLSLALLPYTYVVGLLGAYEMAFLHIGFCHDATPQARRRAKLALLLGVGPHAHRLASFTGPWVRRLVTAPSLGAASKIVTDLGAAREPEITS